MASSPASDGVAPAAAAATPSTSGWWTRRSVRNAATEGDGHARAAVRRRAAPCAYDAARVAAAGNLAETAWSYAAHPVAVPTGWPSGRPVSGMPPC